MQFLIIEGDVSELLHTEVYDENAIMHLQFGTKLLNEIAAFIDISTPGDYITLSNFMFVIVRLR